MTERNYPTRMHEVLELGNQEEFEFKGENYSIDHNGVVYKKIAGSYFFADALIVSDMVNNPERITRRPRLTEEQVEALTALYRVFGCKWLVYDEKRNLSLASKRKPSRTESVGEWDFKGVTLDVWLSDVLTAFAPQGAPLDIVQTLKDAGVEDAVMTVWISVKDRLPEAWQTVLLWDGSEMVSGYADDVGVLIEHRWGLVFRATHWMLPEPPGEEVEG